MQQNTNIQQGVTIYLLGTQERLKSLRTGSITKLQRAMGHSLKVCLSFLTLFKRIGITQLNRGGGQSFRLGLFFLQVYSRLS